MHRIASPAPASELSFVTVWTMVREGEVIAKKVRGRTVIAREELQRVLDEAPSARAA